MGSIRRTLESSFVKLVLALLHFASYLLYGRGVWILQKQLLLWEA